MIGIVVTCSLFFHNMSSRSLTTAAKPSYFLFYICWLSFVLCYFCCSSYTLTHSKPTANSQPCCSACGRSCSTSRASPAGTGSAGRLLLVGTGAPGKGRRMGRTGRGQEILGLPGWRTQGLQQLLAYSSLGCCFSPSLGSVFVGIPVLPPVFGESLCIRKKREATETVCVFAVSHNLRYCTEELKPKLNFRCGNNPQ